MKKKNNVFGIGWVVEMVVGMLIIPLVCLYILAPTDKTMDEVKQEQMQMEMSGEATSSPSFFESFLEGLLNDNEEKSPKLTALDKKKQAAYEAGQAKATQQVQLMRKDKTK